MHRVLRVVWIVFVAATVVYLVVAVLVVRERPPGFAPPLAVRAMKPLLWLGGALVLGGGLVLRSRLLARTYPDADATLLGTQSALVVGWALTEVVAVLGLALVLAGGSLIDAAPFLAVAFLAVLWQRPGAGRRTPPGAH